MINRASQTAEKIKTNSNILKPELAVGINLILMFVIGIS